MQKLWIQGFDNFQNIYGISITELEKEWTTFISTIEPPKEIDCNLLMDEGCG